jgi:hypothetical protein
LTIIDRLPVGPCGFDHRTGTGCLSASARTQRREQTQQLTQSTQGKSRISGKLGTGHAVQVSPAPQDLHRGTVKQAYYHRCLANRQELQLLPIEGMMAASDCYRGRKI